MTTVFVVLRRGALSQRDPGPRRGSLVLLGHVGALAGGCFGNTAGYIHTLRCSMHPPIGQSPVCTDM